ncbi:ADAM32 isoform 11, partial [Pan troglodytes]
MQLALFKNMKSWHFILKSGSLFPSLECSHIWLNSCEKILETGLANMNIYLGFQNSLLQIVIPEKIQTNTNDSSEIEYEQISYIIPIDEKLYTVHLKQRYFLADNFMIYLYNQGSMNTYSSDIQTQCYYQGNIEGYPDSMVTLSTCSGLRGILQFENVSYGIEPLESAVEFQHV